MSTTAERLRQAMAEAGMDQSAVARHIGVTQGAISLILLGKTTRSRYLPEIAQLLGVSLAWLRGEDVPKQPTPNEMLPRTAPTTIRMDVVLPNADALTTMFETILRAFEELPSKAELARALALRLPDGLAQSQGQMMFLGSDEEPVLEEGARLPAKSRRERQRQQHI